MGDIVEVLMSGLNRDEVKDQYAEILGRARVKYPAINYHRMLEYMYIQGAIAIL